MKQYAAVLVAAIATITFLTLALTFLVAKAHKFALGALVIALFALGIGLRELEEVRKVRALRRPPFTTTD
ncbi:hypothetical protein [Pseudoxanthomonas mexicana]|uniref:hypothetical protein n=1 Tax=Pseudoxanthomonas mexicana TaxID=128785 RepID=UPI0028B08DEE|nr:hypothetical protein [Pseudoxanthomonas mexicana]